MQQLDLTIQALWADHHVVALRDTLTALPGVDSVNASAMERRVHIEYDPAQTTPDAIAESLTAAGYAPGALDAADAALQNKPAWATGGLRVTVTNPVDQAMSGDYRKY
jgi:copper chaperone CopZ